MLGAIAHSTSSIVVATGLIYPIIRYHPAIVAQAASPISAMSEGSFTLAMDAGERLNERVIGAPWPSVAIRHAMLGEAIDIFRELLDGGARADEGNYLVLDNAEMVDLTPVDWTSVKVVVEYGRPPVDHSRHLGARRLNLWFARGPMS